MSTIPRNSFNLYLCITRQLKIVVIRKAAGEFAIRQLGVKNYKDGSILFFYTQILLFSSSS